MSEVPIVARPILTGRSISETIDYHPIALEDFEDKTVLDLGTGRSDLGRELAEQGVTANVIGIDKNKGVFGYTINTIPVVGDLTELPILSDSVDIAVASHSLPMWGETPEDIYDFYRECRRVVRVGGILTVYPVWATTLRNQHNHLDRSTAARTGLYRIARLANWVEIEGSTLRRVE